MLKPDRFSCSQKIRLKWDPPIDTNQHNPTKIIDGCQVISKILADKKNSYSQKCNYAIWLKLRKRKWISQHVPPSDKGIYIRWQHLIFLFMYMVQLYKEDWTILRMLGCRAVALPTTEQIDNIFN